MFAEVTDLDAVAEQRPRRPCEDHLAAVSRCHHARGLMDVEPDVVPVHGPRLAGVQTDADPELVSFRPGVGCERTLCLRGSGRGLARRLEGGEEPVALGVEHVTAVALEGLPEELAVPRELLGIPIPQPPKQTRRALDVAEQEGDGAAWRLGHVSSIAPSPRVA
jgi:hypothetical protein